MITMTTWLRRSMLGLLIALVALGSVGAAYQALAAEADKRNFPPPGQLVDVGGFKMHLHCTGEGSPTVILDALSGGFSSYWGRVQPEVATQTRVCAYDRAGFGWSEPGPQPRSLEQATTDLHTLLMKADIAGPYVLVGHSKGGLYVREFAALYPDEVAGLVLLDSSHPDQFVRHPEWLAEETAFLKWLPLISGLSRLGAGHLYFAAGGEIDFKDLPPREHDELAAFWSSPEYWASQRGEIMARPEFFKQAQTLGPLGDLPLAVISRGADTADGWAELQTELAALSTNSIQVTIEGATHGSLVFNQEHAQATSAVILQTVEAARTGERLKP
jgi:pimeloyl-ACP methyl ester carboxylesterase